MHLIIKIFSSLKDVWKFWFATRAICRETRRRAFFTTIMILHLLMFIVKMFCPQGKICHKRLGTEFCSNYINCVKFVLKVASTYSTWKLQMESFIGKRYILGLLRFVKNVNLRIFLYLLRYTRYVRSWHFGRTEVISSRFLSNPRM